MPSGPSELKVVNHDMAKYTVSSLTIFLASCGEGVIISSVQAVVAETMEPGKCISIRIAALSRRLEALFPFSFVSMPICRHGSFGAFCRLEALVKSSIFVAVNFPNRSMLSSADLNSRLVQVPVLFEFCAFSSVKSCSCCSPKVFQFGALPKVSVSAFLGQP